MTLLSAFHALSAAFLMGLLAAAPVGPVNMMAIRRGIAGGWRHTVACGIGSIAAAVVSLAAHFAVGAAKSLITVRSWWSSGFEMTVVGAIEGAVTYGIGILMGASGV